MDTKAIKTALKDARDAIKNKEYAVVMKLSKQILKTDKENYMALVFLGVSLQEIGPKEQAVNAFRKAILVNADQALAWNGLANYYEKQETDNSNKELIPVYEKLLQIESEASKFNDLCTKLVEKALKISSIEKAANILKTLANNDKINENNRRTAWLALASLLTRQTNNNLSSELLNILEETLSTLVKDRSTVTSDFYKEYLKLLYKLKKYDLLFEEAVNMQSLYESTIYPLEWICKIYVELTIEENPLVEKFEDKVDKYCDKMLILQSDAIMAFFVKAVKLYQIKNYLEAKEELRKVVTTRPGLTHAWILLSECLIKLYCYNEALEVTTKAYNLLQSSSKENIRLQEKIDNNLIFALSRHPDSEKWKECVDLSKKVLDKRPNDINILVSTTMALINLENYEEAELYLNKITDKPSYNLLKSKILQKHNEPEKALQLLQELNVGSCEIFIELGTLYWNAEEFENSLISYLKAAKLDPNYYNCFVYLGKCYEHLKDLDKARRCYQKALKINPKCIEAGFGLSNIYRQQKNWDANLELLLSITGTNSKSKLQINFDARWAWLQLGLHYLEQKDFTKSIDCFRTLLRAEPNNGQYWECLADAYMARGSYTSAMKSYEKAFELSDDVLYSKLQFATIKLMLGFYEEAKVSFESILTGNRKYIPALKGLAESCLRHAIILRKDQLLGRAKFNAQYAAEQLTIALKERSDLSCLWKLTGDVCLLVAGLPDKYCHLKINALLAEGRNTEEEITLNKFQLFTLAARCYCKAISLTKSNILLWHDLATCYYSHACHIKESGERKILLNHALATAKYCVVNNPTNWKHWNILGIVSVHQDIKNYALAQHSFIKVVTLNKNCAIAWTNLGTLYLLLDNVQFANKAFSEAQRFDPNYINSWVGQALIAETMGHEDAMDLFRHSTQLGYQSQSAIGYANWVCKTIINSLPHEKIYTIHNMHAIPVATDSLTWYTEHHPNDACAWNMLGILRERLGFSNSTLEAYQNSLKSVKKENEDKVLTNMGRTLIKLKCYNEAIKMYQKITVPNFNNGSGLALALFKAQQFKESYEAYAKTMKWLTENENLQSHVLVALAAMVYKFKGPQEAQTLLLQSTQLKPPSQWAYFGTLAIGLLHGDLEISHLVLKELQRIKDEPDVIYHYSVLHSLTHLRQGDQNGAIRSLINSIHRHPDQASLWHFLSILILQLDSEKKAHLAANFALVSMKMGRLQMDVSKILCIVSLATCVSGDLKSALKYAQKAIHCFPDVAENWAVLISVLCYKTLNKWSNQSGWLKNISKFVNNELKPTEELSAWFNQNF